MNRLKKIGVFLLSICMLAALIPSEAFAASARVSVSSASGNVGSTVTINCSATMTGTSIGCADVTLKYEPSELSLVSCSSGASGGSGGIYFSQNATSAGQSTLSFSVTFRILKEGTFGISVTSYEVTDWNDTIVSTSVSGGRVTGKAVTTNNNNGNTGNNGNNGSTGNNSGTGNTGNNNNSQDNKDSNSKLNNLQVNPGTLAPAFNANTTSYSVTVPGDTKEVTIAATAQSEKSTVSVSGGKDLKLGANDAKVIVTAENGSTTVYNITINCGQIETIQINGTSNTINEEFTNDQIPTGFSRTKITYNGHEYEALTNEAGTIQLVNLQNDAGTAFYIFNQETQEFYNFVQIQFSGDRYIIPIPLKGIREFADNEIITLTLQDKTFDAWKIDDEYSVLLAMTSGGEEVVYQYDSVDGTLQRYAGPVTEEVIEDEEETEKNPFLEKYPLLEEYAFHIMLGLSALSGILFLTLIYFIATRKHRHQARKRKAQKKLEKQQKKLEKQQKKLEKQQQNDA